MDQMRRAGGMSIHNTHESKTLLQGEMLLGLGRLIEIDYLG